MRNNVLAITIGLLCALALSEGLLRIIMPLFMADQLYYRYDKDVGWLLRPTEDGRAGTACLNISGIHVNSLGFRDNEWTLDHYTIAVLGDSFMQGSQLPEGRILPQLNSLLDVL
jgi:hypothetical protein